MRTEPIITSILDTDLYKLSQQQCVLFGKTLGRAYESIDVEYEFINRGKTPFPEGFANHVQREIADMAKLQLQPQEHQFLKLKCPYLKRSYLDFLLGYRFDASQVTVVQHGTDLFVKVKGPWYSTILWEVPLMAIISELYFQNHEEITRYDGPHYLATREQRFIATTNKKAQSFSTSSFTMADFGTRRRYSKRFQEIAVVAFSRVPNFVGSSNLHLCHQFNLLPIGTNAHEFYQAHAAMFGYNNANYYAMEAWLNEFDGSLGHALTDTFTTDVFLKNFHLKHAKLFDGLRQDSGDTHIFVDKVVAKYEELKIDPSTKTIIFSDGLDLTKANQIAAYCAHRGIKCSFGIGTNLTNDIEGVDPLNIVIKMTKCDGVDTVKLSDVPGKTSGHPKAIALCKETLGIA